jgi:ribose transport system substrate-binding protein
MNMETSPATGTTPSSAPVKRSRTSFYLLVLALIVIGGMLCWQMGLFTRSPRIAMVTSGEGPYWDLVAAGAKEAARQYDVKLVVLKSKTDEDAQTQTIRNLLNDRYDGVAVSPVNPSQQAPVLYDVSNKTTLVTFDSDSPESNRMCFIGTDNYAAGRLCGVYARKAIPEGGEVILFAGKSDKESTQHRRQGIVDEMLDRPFEAERTFDANDAPLKGKEYSVAATIFDEANPDAAIQLATKAIAEHPNVKCLIGLNAYHAPALVKALDGAKKLDQIKIVAFDVNPDTLTAIEQGHVYATIMQDQFGCGFHTVRILAETARGNKSGLPMFQKRTLPVEVVTKDNVAAVRAQLEGKPAPMAAPVAAAAAPATPTTGAAAQ